MFLLLSRYAHDDPLGTIPLFLPARKALTCQGAGGCKETSGGQKQGPHIDTDFFWVIGSEATVQGHLKGMEVVSPLTDGAPFSPLFLARILSPPLALAPLALKGFKQPQGLMTECHEGVGTPGLMPASHICALVQLGFCVGRRSQCTCSPCVPGTLCGVTGMSLLGSWATARTPFLSSEPCNLHTPPGGPTKPGVFTHV